MSPEDVLIVMAEMASLGKSEQTRLHVFNLLGKLFSDAIELFRLLDFNPAIKKYRPKVPKKVTKHLSVEQLRRLLSHVHGKEYEIAIWLQLVLGLRCGEMQALRWSDVDFEKELIYVLRARSKRHG